ncbi:MAG TPA: hypothetical protein VFA65_01365 [Bryobacteraceae bacterium]|nr:hypothetical protein [Bryobacteraceae bacterium]
MPEHPANSAVTAPASASKHVTTSTVNVGYRIAVVSDEQQPAEVWVRSKLVRYHGLPD